MRRCILIVGIVVASYASSVHADEHNDATDAAYCIGVFKNNIEYWKKLQGSSVRLAAAISDTEQKQFRKEALVKSTIKQRKIELVTATKMIDVGFADANYCDQTMIKCKEEYGERVQKNVVNVLNKAQFANCTKDAVPICAKAFKTCQ